MCLEAGLCGKLVMIPNYLTCADMVSSVSANPERSVSYVLNRHVRDYMYKDVMFRKSHVLAHEAAAALHSSEIDDIIVTDDNEMPVGIVTDEDILNKVADRRTYAETSTLRDTMSSPLITIHEKATLQDALNKMKVHHIRKLPVVNRSNEILGIIYQHRIVMEIRIAATMHPRLLSSPFRAILGNLGFVLQFAGVLLLVPAIVATLLEDTVIATGIYLTTVLLLVTGFFLNSYGEKMTLNLQQASVLVFSSLFLLTLFGTVPYLYVFQGDAPVVTIFANAFFSSAAGFTTGGISIVGNPEDLSQSLTFYRSYTQLVGGMSFIYLVITAFYPESKLQSMRSFISGKTLHMRGLFVTITVIFAVYILIVAMLLFFLGGHDNLLDDFSLAMSTLATGGFVPTSDILQNLGWQENIVLMGAMILGALPFTFHYAFVRKKFLAPKLGKEVLVYFTMLTCATAMFMLVSDFDPLQSAFYSISASTTAGLQAEHLSGMSSWAASILIVLMVIGGCGFSTAGGLKIFRIFPMKHCISIFIPSRRRALPGQTVKDAASSLIIVALIPAVAAVTGLHLAAIEDVSYQDAFLESIGVITTGGLSAGVIDAETDPATKVVLGFLMIFGRLEIIAIIYMFVPRLM